MADNERPLPAPPRSRFGRQLRGDDEAAGPLTADRMAQAAAEGRLEEFLHQEIPEGEHARNLAMMMMGMSGMMPAAPMPPTATAPGLPPVEAAIPAAGPAAGPAAEAPPAAAAPVPPEVLAAIGQADVAGLTELLRAEHAKRSGAGPGAEAGSPAGRGPTPSAAAAPGGGAPARPGIDAAIVDELIRIAADNDVTVDWLTLRAVRLYVEDYRRTGRL